MSTMTLAQLKTAVRQRADMEHTQFVSDAELTSYINQSYFELYDLLIQKYGNDYYVADPYSITTDGTHDKYALPDDFYKLLGVDLALANSLDSFITIRPFNWSDRNRYAVPNFQNFYGVTNLRYRIQNNKIWLTPKPQAGQTIRINYVPRMTELVDDSDVVDGISGWTEYIIIDAAIKCLQKEESDPTVLAVQKVAMIKRIEAAAENRDTGFPATVSDSQYLDYFFPSGSGSGYGSGSY